MQQAVNKSEQRERRVLCLLFGITARLDVWVVEVPQAIFGRLSRQALAALSGRPQRRNER